MDAVEYLLLLRVVSQHLIQDLEVRFESLCTLPVGMKEALVAGCDVSALRRFHINQQLEKVSGLVENLIRVVNPLHRSV
jgi:hypothetical protein